jgi:hypothetical protein
LVRVLLPIEDGTGMRRSELQRKTPLKRIDAIRALRLNYRWRGVWIWLRGRNQRYGGRRGWRVLLTDPERVIRDQDAIAEGYFS